MVLLIQVAELERQVALGCRAGTAMLLERLAQPAAVPHAGAGSAAASDGQHELPAEQQGPAEAAAPDSLQTRLCAWLGEAFERLQSSGVAASSGGVLTAIDLTGAGEDEEEEAGSDAESSLDDSDASDEEEGVDAPRPSASKTAAQVCHPVAQTE